MLRLWIVEARLNKTAKVAESEAAKVDEAAKARIKKTTKVAEISKVRLNNADNAVEAR